MTFKRNTTDLVPYSLSQRVTPGPGVWMVAVWLLLLLFLYTGWNGSCCANNLPFNAVTLPLDGMESCCPVDGTDHEVPPHNGNEAHAHTSCTGSCAIGEECASCTCHLEETPGPDNRAVASSKRTVITAPAIASAYSTGDAHITNQPHNAVLVHRAACPSVPAYLMNCVLLN